MPPTPNTFVGVASLIVLVLPGIVYTYTRFRLRGIQNGQSEPASLILRALVFSVVLDTVCLVSIGPWMMKLLRLDRTGTLNHPRTLGAMILILGVLTPIVIATITSWSGFTVRRTPVALPFTNLSLRIRPRVITAFEATPTAWDKVAPHLGGKWIRVRMSDGHWVGGWYSDKSYVSTYPEPPDVFIESMHHMNDDGTFGEEVAHTAGVWVPLSDSHVVEWIDRMDAE